MARKSVFFCIKLILWKNYLIRKRHHWLTLIEIAIPFLLFIQFIGYFQYKRYCAEKYTKRHQGDGWIPASTFYDFCKSHDVYYTPNTTFTTELMNQVQIQMGHKITVVKGVNSETELLLYYDLALNAKKGYEGVMFRNLNDSDKYLEYVLKPATYELSPWFLRELFVYEDKYKGMLPYLRKCVLGMQLALDISYIQMMSKKKVPVTVGLQQFPHGPFDKEAEAEAFFSFYFPWATMLSFFFIFPFILASVMDEKTTGIKELMKMMGLKSWMLWLGWFINALMANIISIVVILFLLKVNLFGGRYHAVMPYCSTSVFAVLLLLYCINIVTFVFLVSSIFTRTIFALIVAITSWIIFGQFGHSPDEKLATKIFLSIISPNRVLMEGCIQISKYEARTIGSNWDNLFISPTHNANDITVGMTFIILGITSIFYMLLAMYLEVVNPGPHGVAKPPHFILLKIWHKISRRRHTEDLEARSFEVNPKIEGAPKLIVGISVRNLYKKFKKHYVVNDFSIDIYRGQITALLGHNGAGKTTTMSIITGMTRPTSGKVLINNKDIKQHKDEIRGTLGFCPQINIHFKDLNVMEHLIFFSMLKGSSAKRAREEATELLVKMNLVSKKYNVADSLSGGMQRRLSLGMALTGKSKVLILDEPTSGLDPEARREIWDILLTFRGSRTIIITTHFMEEADVLGDRIAIMDHGKLVCYGTSMFLKREYGAGYNLTLVGDEKGYKAQFPNGPDQVTAFKSLVQKTIPSAILLSASGNRVKFVLPHDTKSKFGELLGDVESKKDALFIANIALSVTTLEDVFLKVDSTVTEEHETYVPNDNQSEGGNVSFVRNTNKKRTGCKLLRMQISRLFKKRILVLRRKWKIFIAAVIIAVTATVLTLYLGEDSNDQGYFNFDLDRYGETTVYYTLDDGGDSFFQRVQDNYRAMVMAHGSIAKKVDNLLEGLIEMAKKNIKYYKYLFIVAADINNSNQQKRVTAQYSSYAYHGLPISLNLVTNSLLKTIMGTNHSITASIAPLPVLNQQTIVGYSAYKGSVVWILLFPLGVLFLTGTFLMFPLMERISKVKQLQLMCGVIAAFYWLVCYVIDFLLYVIAVAMIISSIKVYGKLRTDTFSGENEIEGLLVMLLAYGVSVIPFAYIFTYKKTTSSAFVWYVTLNSILGIVFLPLMILANFKLNYIFIIPHVGLLILLYKFSFKVATIYHWDNSSPARKRMICLDPSAANACCRGEHTRGCKNFRSYLASETNLYNYKHILLMLASSIIYIIILLLLESNFVRRCWERAFVEGYSSKKKRELLVQEQHEEDVVVEIKRIADLINQEQYNLGGVSDINLNEERLLVHQIQKKFVFYQAVKCISFAVQAGECFGLLGVNGAGKTTTFRILTGDLPLIYGEARILTPAGERIYLSTQQRKYLKNVGYCPQFDALNEVLTAREMLKLFADLRGIQKGAKEEINMWIKILGLEEFANKPCGVYSGGNKRKLSVAMALIGGPSVVLLDEPTSGVDPVSRRKLWDTLSVIQRQDVKPSIILTSHSMDECEALCYNLVIMKAGELECYGTIPNIKKKYAQGFTVMLKLRYASNPEIRISIGEVRRQSSSGVQQSVEESIDVQTLMNDIETQYKGCCTLKDQHTGLLHYHINDKNKKWSQMYNEIEQLSRKHIVIEDYNISETTLEEVFLSIARK